MVRTQIQLPDDLYRRAKQFAAEREISLAEVTRRGMEALLDRYPPGPSPTRWTPPLVVGVTVRVPLSDLKDIAADEEQRRGLSGR